MAETLAALALRITAEDLASGVLQRFGQQLATETETVAAASSKAAGAHEQHTTALGKLGNAFKSVGQEALRLATFQSIWNLEGSIAQQVTTAAEAFDKFGTAVAGVQRLTGETAENSSLLLGTLTRYGLTSDQASTALVKLARSMAGTEDAMDVITAGGKSGAQQLEALGISSQTAAGGMKSQLDVMLELADAIKGKSAQEQISIIATIFKVRGNEAADLQRVLNQGRGAIEDYFKVLQSTGNVVNQAQVDDVLALGEAHRRLDLALTGAAIAFGNAFAPAIATTATVIARLAMGLDQTIIPALQKVPGLLPIIATGLGVLVAGAAIAATAEMVKFAVTGLGAVISGATQVGAALVPLVARYAAVAAAAAAAAAAQIAAWLAAAGPIVLVIAGIAAAAGAIALVLSGKLGEAKDAIGAGIQKIGQAVTDGWAAITKLSQPFDAGKEAGTDFTKGVEQGVSESAAEKMAKAAKTSADTLLKGVQDATAQRKEGFEVDQLGAETAAMQAKLTADVTANNSQLVAYKRQIEDLDASSVNYALKRQQLDEQDAITVAKMTEDKLRGQADDLSYQEKLLLAQARATRAAGGSVDMGALRSQILSIRQQQIQNEPGLLIAEHGTALAERAKQGTDAQASLQTSALERAKLGIQEAMRPLEDAATQAKRVADDAQLLVTMAKSAFDISEQQFKTTLINAQEKAKKADEDYQAAVAAVQAKAPSATPGGGSGPQTAAVADTINAAGGVGTKPYGPGFVGALDVASRAPLATPVGVPGGPGGTGLTVNINQQNALSGEADEDRLAQKTADVMFSALNAATAQQSNTKPAYQGLPGAFAASTP